MLWSEVGGRLTGAGKVPHFEESCAMTDNDRLCLVIGIELPVFLDVSLRDLIEFAKKFVEAGIFHL